MCSQCGGVYVLCLVDIVQSTSPRRYSLCILSKRSLDWIPFPFVPLSAHTPLVHLSSHASPTSQTRHLPKLSAIFQQQQPSLLDKSYRFISKPVTLLCGCLIHGCCPVDCLILSRCLQAGFCSRTTFREVLVQKGFY